MPRRSETIPPRVTVVHEGRGGHVCVEDARYPIEHVEGGRFAIAFPHGTRGAARARHLRALEDFVAHDPTRWSLDVRRRRARITRSERASGAASDRGRRGST